MALKSNRSDVLAALVSARERALERCGLAMESRAKRIIAEPKAGHKTQPDPRPSIDTDNLRGSITHAADDERAIVGTNVFYAPDVELGTSKSKAFPFLVPAVRDHMDDYKKIIEHELKHS